MEGKKFIESEDNSQHIVINTVPYHPEDISFNDNDNKYIENNDELNNNNNNNNNTNNNTNNMRLHESQIPPVPYINSFGVGIPPSNSVPGGLLQGSNLNPFPSSQPRMPQLYSNSNFSSGVVDMDPMKNNHLSSMMSQPSQLLHLQSFVTQDNSNVMDIQRPTNIIDPSVPLPNPQMLLSQPGMLAHTQRTMDHPGDPSRLPYPQSLVGVSNQQNQNKQAQSRWAVGTSVRKPWHSEAHAQAKKEMNEKIIELLQQRRPNATADWHQKLPQMAKRLEEALYSEANSFEQYNDKTTLKTRLQQLASSMGSKIGPSKNSSINGSSNNNGNGNGNGNVNVGISGVGVGGVNNGNNINSNTINNNGGISSINNINNLNGNNPNSNVISSQPQGLLHGQMQQSSQLQTHHGPVVSHTQQNITVPHNMRLGNNQPPPPGNISNNPNLRTNSSSNIYTQPPYHQPNHQIGTILDRPQVPPSNTSTSMQPSFPMNNRQFVSLTQINPIYNLSQESNTNVGISSIDGPRMVPNYPTDLNSLSSSSLNNGGISSNSDNRKTLSHSSTNLTTNINTNSNIINMNGNIGISNLNNNNITNNNNINNLNGNIGGIGNNNNNNHTHTHGHGHGSSGNNGSNGNNNNGNNGSGNGGSGSGSGSSNHTDEHHKQVLKQQQQRLLLLRHASKCPHEGDRCPVTPHCASMKQLWSHIMSCKAQECTVPHCVSSRFVLSHYSKCKNPNCPVCGPVRDVIKKNVDKNQTIASTMKNNSNNNDDSQGGNINHNINGIGNNGSNNMLIGNSNGGGSGNNNNNNNNSSMIGNNGTSSNSGGSKKLKTEIVTSRFKAITTDNVSCAIYSFTDQQIRAHINHLQDGLRMKASDVKEVCLPLIDDILKHQNGYIFACPVDPIVLGIPDYPTIIKQPMDIGTVKKRLDSGYYRDIQECAADVRLCFDNAMLYNPIQTEVHKVAKSFKTSFDRDLKKKLDSIEREIETKRLNPDNCPLCGEGEIMYEPPNIYCNGRCTSQRIRRNSYYYVGNGAYHWCPSCYNELKDPIRLINDGVLYKKDLIKKKHVEEIKEPWVLCDQCERWVHQICSLFNGRRNISVEMPFLCPLCILEQRKKHSERFTIPEKKTQAIDLPHTVLSEFIEKRVSECLERCYEQQSIKLGKSIDEIEKAPALCVRQVASVDHPQRVREGMLERYKHKNYPTEFPCRSKCILLFQNLDGQDVILFGMYVYEYGHKTPQPNQRRVYISYLDSVHYFRPRQYRTPVYHEIIISYLEYVKLRGFHTAHIWACPPMKGDDYIFNCHPQDQKTPKDDRLRLWYVSVLEKCKERGIVQEVVDFHTEFMADPSNDATVMPYFDGDYWVGEAENIIRNIKSGDVTTVEELDESGGSDDEACSRSKRKAKSKTKNKRNTRPRLTRGTSSRPERDIVMAKLSSIIEPMKEAFFVARLHSKEYALDCAVRRAAELAAEANASLTNPQDEEKNDQKLREEALTSNDNNTNNNNNNTNNSNNNTLLSTSTSISTTTINNNNNVDNNNNINNNNIENNQSQIVSTDTSNPLGKQEAVATTMENNAEMKSDNEITRNSLSTSEITSSASLASSSSNSVILNDTTKSISSNQSITIKRQSSSSSINELSRSSSTNPNGNGTNLGINISGKSIVTANIRDDTEDGDDTQENEHFETRLAFLNLCQGNHYQFDQLRRAKYTSLMTLYHLHNPDAPKFSIVCEKCSVTILTGHRYNCEPCEMDYCQNCYSQHGSKIHHHPLRPIVVSGGQPAMQLTEEQRRERQRSISLHLQLLEHSSTCDGIDCKSKNCSKMKDFLKHGKTCQDGLKKGCPICKRVLNLLNLHARNCKKSTCDIPKCREIKEHIRKNALKQQQMDDRRRQMMNDMYRGNQSNSSTS